MSSRERKLLIFFGVAIFLMANFFGFSWLTDKRGDVEGEIIKYEGILREAELFGQQQEAVREEMDWLVENVPEPEEGELVPSKLEQFANAQATSSGLTVSKRTIQPKDETGTFFHRARVEMKVSGTEKSLYDWFYRLQDPGQFRALTALRLSPNREDDTLIDAVVEVEEWYVPMLADNNAVVPEE